MSASKRRSKKVDGSGTGAVDALSMLCLGLATLAHSLTVWAPVSRDVNLLLMNIGGL